MHPERRLLRHCTAAFLTLSMAAAAAAQTPGPAAAPAMAEGAAEFTIFLGGSVAGREQARVSRSGNIWILSSSGTMGQSSTRFEAKYTADLHPQESRFEMRQQGHSVVVATSYGGTSAINEITQNGTTTAKTDQISARSIVLPNNFFAAYEMVALRLRGLRAGAELPAYVTPQAEIKLLVKNVAPGHIESPSGKIATERFTIEFQNPSGPLAAEVTIDDRARLVRLEIGAAGLAVVRSDLATVATRVEPARNPTDTDVTIPASGFSLAGTITTPPATGRMRHPAVILVAGSGAVDRDETVAGIPIFTQLAQGLADHGFLVLRYDKRGVGQSGGRTERVTLQDYADDLITVTRWLERRDDVDRNSITVVGHSEGGAVAMLAAARERRIDALVLVAAPGTTGAELILEQQRHTLDVLKTPDAERQQKIDLQKRIQEAVVTEKWEGIDEPLREQADSPWFRSLLLFDPAAVMPRIPQPILILQPDLDRQVPAHHGDRLAELARARKDRQAREAVELAHLPGLNHLLVPAQTGEVMEYASLPEKRISPDVAARIAAWVKK